MLTSFLKFSNFTQFKFQLALFPLFLNKIPNKNLNKIPIKIFLSFLNKILNKIPIKIFLSFLNKILNKNPIKIFFVIS